MQAHAIPVVQKSWLAVTVIAAAAAELFYCNLHTPSLQRLFKADMSVQDEKLMRMIGIAVAKLDDMAILITALQNLGERHSSLACVMRTMPPLAKPC